MANKFGVPSHLPDGRSNPQYDQLHRREYSLTHKEEIRFLNHRYYTLNRQRLITQQAEWYSKNKEKVSVWSRKYYLIHKNERCKYVTLYLKTPSGKAAKTRARDKRLRGMPIWFILNSPFPKAHLHHIESHIGIYIPESLHKSISHDLKSGRGMIQINQAVSEWMRTQG